MVRSFQIKFLMEASLAQELNNYKRRLRQMFSVSFFEAVMSKMQWFGETLFALVNLEFSMHK